ncbi:MAG TPA: hypothetical protein VGV18_10935, partial [Verrucomicrobiae bacterium]|nr:hypothetical protein [Verrucomicrobiae bacterium]
MKLKLYTFALMGALVSQQSAMTQTTPDTNVATPTVPMTASTTAQSAWPTNSISSNSAAVTESATSNLTQAAGDQAASAPQTNMAAAPVAPAVADAANDTNSPGPATPSAPTSTAPAMASDTNSAASTAVVRSLACRTGGSLFVVCGRNRDRLASKRALYFGRMRDAVAP